MAKRSARGRSTARLVMDPDLPKKDRDLLLDTGGIPGSAPPRGGLIPKERPVSIRFMAVAGVGLIGVVWAAVEAGEVAAIVVAVLALVALAGVGLADMSSRYMRDQNRRLRNLGGRYVTPGDLDSAARGLLGRAQAAEDTVLRSTVAKAGLLDHVSNQVLLPRLEWELALGLRGLSDLRQAGPGGERAAAAEAEAAAGLERRVVALEDYADQVRAADAAYALAPLEARQPATDLEAMTGQALAATEALRDVIHQAAEAAVQLPLTA